MKFQRTIHGLFTVSFKTVNQINPATNEPTGVVLDSWQEIQAASAMGLEELQNRIDKIEKVLGNTLTEEKIVLLLEVVDKMTKQKDKPPKEIPPPGVPLSKVKKGGRPKKAPVAP